jgi:hypothetical protein
MPQVSAVLLLEDAALAEADDIMGAPWFRLTALLQRWCPTLNLEEWAEQARQVGAAPGGWDRQLDAALAARPPSCDPQQWEALVAARLADTERSGAAWEELLASWVALHSLLLREHAALAGTGLGSSAGSAGSVTAAGSSEEEPGAGGAVPPRHVLLQTLFQLEGDPEGQLDYLAQYRPLRMSVADWDRAVSQVRGQGWAGVLL